MATQREHRIGSDARTTSDHHADHAHRHDTPDSDAQNGVPNHDATAQ